MDERALAKSHIRLTVWDTYWTVVHDFYVLYTATSTATTLTVTSSAMTTTTYYNGIRTATIIRCNSITRVQMDTEMSHMLLTIMNNSTTEKAETMT